MLEAFVLASNFMLDLSIKNCRHWDDKIVAFSPSVALVMKMVHISCIQNCTALKFLNNFSMGCVWSRLVSKNKHFFLGNHFVCPCFTFMQQIGMSIYDLELWGRGSPITYLSLSTSNDPISWGTKQISYEISYIFDVH